MKRKITVLSLTVLALTLEILPYGAVCNFATSEGGRIRETYSYFDLIPFGYANFAPLLTAFFTCLLLLLSLVSLITGKSIRKPILYVSVITAVLSLCPLLLGISFFSPVGAAISAALIGAAVTASILK